MILYHYRSVESALKEIGDCTFHFASCAELNDPLEGYVRVFWQGDKAAWEGMLRNFICSLNQAIDLYLFQCDEDMLHHKSLVIDLHQYDDVPLGEILKDLGDRFLEDEYIQKVVDFYGNQELKVFEKELRFMLRFVLNKALFLCIQKCRENRAISESVADNLLKTIPHPENNSTLSDFWNEKLLAPNNRTSMLEFIENFIEDMYDWHYVHLGFDDESFLYGPRKDESGKIIQDNLLSEARRRRNWMSIVVDFPRVYVDQLKEMIYPESYVVCFSAKNNDSAMWGNYADNHRGVCLIYETDDKNHMTVKREEPFEREVKPVNYGGDIIERNFFESFGRLTLRQIRTWLTGTDNISNCYEIFSDLDKWRQRYWEAYEAKTYRKLKDWEQENEYRLAIENTFYSFNTPESRNLKYNPQNLKGVIFGINTTEYDKQRIMKQLCRHIDEYGDIVFHQAEYDSGSQTIVIRKKNSCRMR